MVFTPSPQTQSNLSKAASLAKEGGEPRGRECREGKAASTEENRKGQS